MTEVNTNLVGAPGKQSRAEETEVFVGINQGELGASRFPQLVHSKLIHVIVPDWFIDYSMGPVWTAKDDREVFLVGFWVRPKYFDWLNQFFACREETKT